MATEKNSTALAPLESFALAKPFDGIPDELVEELKDQMEDLDSESGITCRTIKVPSGGALAYEVQGEDDDAPEYMKEVSGVIIFTHRMNGYWPESFGASTSPENKLPSCSSMDGKTGIWTETGEIRNCENCPFNQYGSADDGKGGNGRGKACKNMRRLYLMQNSDPNIYLLSVPPTSIKDVNKQLVKIMGKGIPYTSMVVSLTLEKATNATGINYAKVLIKQKGLLPDAASETAKEMRRQIKAQYQSMAITLDDYISAPAQGAAADSTSTAPDAQTAEFVDAADLPF